MFYCTSAKSLPIVEVDVDHGLPEFDGPLDNCAPIEPTRVSEHILDRPQKSNYSPTATACLEATCITCWLDTRTLQLTNSTNLHRDTAAREMIVSYIALRNGDQVGQSRTTATGSLAFGFVPAGAMTLIVRP